MIAPVSRTTVLALWITAALIATWLIAPTLVIIPLSFTGQASFKFPPESWSLRWYEELFTNSQWGVAVLNSFVVALLSAALATALGAAAAVGMYRLGSRRMQLFRGLILAPLVVPAVVIAAGLYRVFLETGLTGTIFGFVVAHAAMGIPFVFVAVSTSLSQFDQSLDLAAASLGASRWVVFRTVTAPQIAPGILSGAAFAFFISFDETMISVFIQSPAMQTLPVRIFNSVARETNPSIAAIGTVSVLITGLLCAVWFIISVSRSSRKQTK